MKLPLVLKKDLKPLLIGIVNLNGIFRMFLEQNKFLEIVESTPLIAIDLILKKWAGKVLKNEFLSNAVKRIANSELDISLDIKTYNLLCDSFRKAALRSTSA